MAATMIESLDQTPGPLRLILGRDSQERIARALQQRLAGVKAQEQSAKSTGF
jgi:hypothetical protein